MSRIVGQFRLEIADAVPEEVTQIKFTAYQTGVTFNPSTGESGTPTDRITHYTSISRASDGSANFTITLLPDNQSDTSHFTIKAEAMDANDNIIQERIFEDAPIKANHKTVYHGSFFTSASTSFSMTAESDWESFGVIEY